jgi:6-phosphogluconolactonase (cycloisomerase 2 family)
MTGPGQSTRAITAARLTLLVVVGALMAALPASALANQHGKRHHARSHHAKGHGAHQNFGTVYTATNDPSGNAVVMYTRNANGTLTKGASFPTGGPGIATEPPFGFPIVDSSGSMNLTRDGRLLFVVNAGPSGSDGSITAFRVTSSGLQRADNSPIDSGGVLPISLTSSGNLLYVVNEESSNIVGYRFSSSGHLTQISEQSLSTIFPATVAAQIGFSPDGRQLVVTERGLPAANGVIDTFPVYWNGTAGPAQKLVAPTPNPFGFAFSDSRHLLVTDAGFVATPSGTDPNPGDPSQFFGSASSYSLSNGGALTFKGEFPSGGRAACWVVVTQDGRYAFVTNTLSAPAGSAAGALTGTGGVSRYAVSRHGRLSLLGQTDVPASQPTEPSGFPGEEALSSDGRYLYVLVPLIVGGPTGTSHLVVYRIGPGGSLTLVQATNNDLPNGVSGLAAS